MRGAFSVTVFSVTVVVLLLPQPAMTAAKVRHTGAVELGDRRAGRCRDNLEEKDATGQGRLLIVDSNWEVVSQKPAAGSKVGENTRGTLSSKEIGE